MSYKLPADSGSLAIAGFALGLRGDPLSTAEVEQRIGEMTAPLQQELKSE